MKAKRNILSTFGFYPLLLGLYPVLYLWLANYSKVVALVVPRSLALSFGFAVLVYLVTFLIIRRPRQSAAVAGLFLLLFYFYGHVFSLVDNALVMGFNLGRHRYLLLLWLALFIAGTIWILRAQSDLRCLTWILNLVSIFMVTTILIQIGFQYVQLSSKSSSAKAANTVRKTTQNAAGQGSGQADRDIYYILLDAYAREDVMKSEFSLDNRPFISQLEQLGFVVPNCTQSNYEATIETMTSVFNLDYLDKLGVLFDKFKEPYLAPLVRDNLVFNTLKSRGYQLITFKSIYPPLDFKDQADVYFDIEKTTQATDKLEALLFQGLFVKTTMLRGITELQQFSPVSFDKLPPQVIEFLNPDDERFNSRNYRQYQQNLYALDELEKTPQIPGKKFVYAHLFVTHPPFTFRPDGSFRMEFRDSFAGYRDQARYANQRILQIVKTILKESSVPPIIVIQSDHNYAFSPDIRDKNLNALYLPEGGNAKVYPQMTSVNTFRLIFSHYFNLDYPFLPDTSYAIDSSLPDGYRILPGSCVSQEK